MSRALLALLFMAAPVQAGPLHHVIHYVKTHKLLLASDAIIMAGQMADSASTVHCMHYSPYCTENNPALPLRPSNAQLYGYSGGLGAGVIVFQHLVWHFAPTGADRREVVIWFAAPFAIGDALQTKMNVDSLSIFQKGGK